MAMKAVLLFVSALAFVTAEDTEIVTYEIPIGKSINIPPEVSARWAKLIEK